jgi:hypothetical protein
MTINCVGIFCEDIREEVGGTHTIIGVMPDNIGVSAPPESGAGDSLLFPRIGIYIRINLDSSNKPDRSITAKASIPGMADFALGEMGTESLEKAFADAAAKNNPMVGVIFKGVATPVQLRASGVAKATVTINGEEILCATLNIHVMR